MRKHNLTREERALRRAKVAYLLFVVLWAVILIAVAVGLAPSVSCVETEAEPEATVVIDEPPTPTEEAQVTIEIPEPVVVIEPPVVVEPDPVPIREDIPLDAETQRLLYQACEETGIDYYLMVALIERESNFRNITGDGGDSEGYCQIQKKWWSGLMADIGAEDLNNPKDNFRTGCAILNYLMERYDGDIAKALVAYNQGHYKDTVTKYAASILERAEAWRGDGGD